MNARLALMMALLSGCPNPTPPPTPSIDCNATCCGEYTCDGAPDALGHCREGLSTRVTPDSFAYSVPRTTGDTRPDGELCAAGALDAWLRRNPAANCVHAVDPPAGEGEGPPCAGSFGVVCRADGTAPETCPDPPPPPSVPIAAGASCAAEDCGGLALGVRVGDRDWYANACVGGRLFSATCRDGTIDYVLQEPCPGGTACVNTLQGHGGTTGEAGAACASPDQVNSCIEAAPNRVDYLEGVGCTTQGCGGDTLGVLLGGSRWVPSQCAGGVLYRATCNDDLRQVIFERIECSAGTTCVDTLDRDGGGADDNGAACVSAERAAACTR